VLRTAAVLCILLLAAGAAFGHSEYVALNQILMETGAWLEWDPLRRAGRIRLGDGAVSFKMGSPLVLLGYKRLFYTEPLTWTEGAVFLPAETARVIKDYFASSTGGDGNPRVAVIFIDPGHGGKDPGAYRIYDAEGKSVVIREKDIVLDVSMKLDRLLKQAYPNRKILMSRDSDTFVELEERAQMANGIELGPNEAILFLSIHANAAFRTASNGFEVWILSPQYERDLLSVEELDEGAEDILPILNSMREVEFSTESIILAREILSGLQEEVGAVSFNRGLKEEEWFVVRNSKMPAVLIEVGFLTNREEAFRMTEESYLQDLADGIYNGVSRFVAQFESTQGFTE